MRHVVVYLMTGTGHLPYLLVCLHTLRKHYNGEVVVYCTQDETLKLCIPLAKVYGASVRKTEAMREIPRKNRQFTTKVRLFKEAKELPDATCCYLDADLIIRGGISRLFDGAEQFGFCATQFCNWVTTGGRIRSRIERWRQYGDRVDQDRVTHSLSKPFPSPNGGVFAAVPGSKIFDEWLEWTVIGKDQFISDEAALNILHPLWTETFRATVIAGGSFNCSPKHKPDDLGWDDVSIIHGHGNSFARREKRGVDLWLPEFRKLYQKNAGGCRDWGQWHCGNRHLAGLEL